MKLKHTDGNHSLVAYVEILYIVNLTADIQMEIFNDFDLIVSL